MRELDGKKTKFLLLDPTVLIDYMLFGAFSCLQVEIEKKLNAAARNELQSSHEQLAFLAQVCAPLGIDFSVRVWVPMGGCAFILTFLTVEQ